MTTGHAMESDQNVIDLDAIYRRESRRVYATLVRVLGGNFELAEDAMHEAFAIATERWHSDGIPDNPYTWLVSTGKFRAIDTIRRGNRFASLIPKIAQQLETTEEFGVDGEAIEDDQLRMIFTCCHPSLSRDARISLTLREVCGLSTEAIARAYLTAPSTVAQRIVRAKAKIRKDAIPYQVPEPDDLPQRLDPVLQVIYLVFNEGYMASLGASLTRPDLSGEAIRLGRLLDDLLDDPEVKGLLGLMLLHEARRDARTSAKGDLVPLEEQDRRRWNQAQIAEGQQVIRDAIATQRLGPYTLQAMIASVHAEAVDIESTDWARIVAIYDLLNMLTPSPVVELNRAAAVAMRDGAETGLHTIDALLDQGHLLEYHSAHAARADLLRRLGRVEEAKVAYERALKLVPQEQERRFLKRRLAELDESKENS